MPSSRLDLVRQGFEVYNAAGPGGFVDFLVGRDVLHPDFRFHIQEDLPNGGDWHGVEGFNEMTRSWLEAWDEFTIEPHEYIEASADGVLVPLRQRVVATGSGIELEAEFFYVLLFADGKVEQIHLYSDRGQAERAATRAASP